MDGQKCVFCDFAAIWNFGDDVGNSGGDDVNELFPAPWP